MNPAKRAITSDECMTRSVCILRTLGAAAAIGYASRALSTTQRLYLAHMIQARHGTYAAAVAMRRWGASIECALHHLIGPRAVERLAMMSEAA
jgi:hypothetical protein